MSFLQKIKSSGFFWSNYVVGISTLARIFSGLLKNKASAVFLGPVGMGVLGIAGQMQLLLLSLGSLSIGSGVIQMMSHALSDKNQGEKNAVLATAFTLLLLFNFLFLALALVALPWLAPIAASAGTTVSNLLPVLFAVPFSAFVVSYFQCILFSHGRYDLWTKANVTLALFDLIIFISLSWMFGVQGALWATGLSMVFLALLCAYYCLKTEKIRTLFSFGFSKNIALSLGKFGGTGLVTSSATYLFGIFLRILLVHRFGAEINGAFQAVCVVSGFYTQLLTNGIWAQLFPLVSKAANPKEISYAWSESLSMISCMGALILSALLLHPGFLISALFSKQFLAAIDFLPTLLLGDFFYLIAQPSLGVMLGKRSLTTYTFTWCAYFVLLAFLSVLGAIQWGIIGVGIGHLGANAALALAGMAFYFKSKPAEGRKTSAYLLLLGSLLAIQFTLWEYFGSEQALGFMLRALCFGVTMVIAALGMFHFSDSGSGPFSIKTHILNIFRSIFMLPFLEPLVLKVALATKDNRWVFRSLPNHYQFPKPSLRAAKRNGILYQLDIADFIDWHIYFGYSEGTKVPLYEMVNSNDLVIDVGANIGETALEMAKKVGPAGKVIAFEPDPLMREKFLKNFSFNPWAKITLEPWALSDVAASHRLYRVSERNPAGNKIMLEGSGDFVNIEAVRLDDYVREQRLERVNVIKIDVEGFEKHVLLGAEATILRFRPKLFLEISQGQLKLQNTSAKEIFMLLEKWGYLISYAHDSNPVTSASELKSTHFDVMAFHADFPGKVTTAF